METQNIQGTITQGSDGKLTLRVWLNDSQKRLFCLEDGKTRSFDEVYGSVIIMPKYGNELTQTKRMEKAELRWALEVAKKENK